MILTIQVKPSAKETKLIAQRDAQTFVVAVAAPATEGKANRELIRFLSEQLGIAKSLIEIKRGQGSRVKHVSVPGEANMVSLINKR